MFGAFLLRVRSPWLYPSDSPNNHNKWYHKFNKWYQSRMFAPTWWWPSDTMGSVEEGLRADSSHRPDGDW